MSALRYPQAALRLLSVTWRNRTSQGIGSRNAAPFSSLSWCRLSSVKPDLDKQEEKSEEKDMDPFGLGDTMTSKVKSNVLVQGFYAADKGDDIEEEKQPPKAAPSPPPRTSGSPEEKVDKSKLNRLALYDNWLQKRTEINQGIEDGDAERFRDTTFGTIRMDSDNPSYTPSKFQQQARLTKEYVSNRTNRSEDYDIAPGNRSRSIDRDRQRLKSQQQKDEMEDEEITETINMDYSQRMRASDFVKNLRRSQGQDPDAEDTDERRKLVIEKVIKPRNQEEDLDDREINQMTKEDSSYMDSNVLPKEYRLPDYNQCTEADMWSILKKCVVFENEFLLAINKPSGVPIHSKSRDCRHVIINFLDKFADLAKCEEIFPLHRLDKETTGVMIFAKEKKAAAVLKEKFAKRQITKVYLGVTKLCPRMSEGTIKIPIGEGKIPNTNEKKYRQVLRPDLREYGIKPTTRGAVEAITDFKVLKSIKEAAFVEIKPITGYKHQIRVHFGMGLGCPVLGDHKYSHRDKLAPQRLAPLVLHRMKIKQSKVREVPLHLHCYQVGFTLPKEFTSSTEPIYIHAKIPLHMRYTLKRLNLIR